MRCADLLVALPADALQLVAEALAVLVLALVGVVLGMDAGEHARGQHGRRVARALLVRPVGDDDRVLGLDVEVVQRADDFESAEYAEHAVELAAGRLRVEMAADIDRQRFRVGAFAAREHRAHLVDAHFEPRRLAPCLEETASLAVLIGQRLAVVAAGDAGADLRHLHQRIPQTVGIDAEILAGADMMFRHRLSSSSHRADRVADVVDQLVDLALGDDQRRRERYDIAGDAQQRSMLERPHERVEGAFGRLPAIGCISIAPISPMLRMSMTFGSPLSECSASSPVGRQLRAARQQAFFLVGVERADRGRRGDRISRIGVAVEELDQMLRPVHEGVVDFLGDEHRAHRDDAVGKTLGGDHDVRRHAEIVGRERRAQTAETGDHFVEDQQDAMLGADFAQPLEVAFRAE